MSEEKNAQELIDRLHDEVQSLLSQSNNLKAIQVCLAEIPSTKKDALKAKHAETVSKALCSIKDAQIKSTLSDLNEDEKANAMKYTYKAMSVGDKDSCPTLLKWHAALLEAGGVGIIARAMVDRKV